MPTFFTHSKLIALDIGGVCISLHFERCLRDLGLSCDFVPPPEFQRQCFLLETGRITDTVWLQGFVRFLNGRFSEEELHEIWNGIIGNALPEMYETVKELLGKGYRFVYFSNTSAIHMNRFFRTNSFCHLVDGGIFSYEVGCAKPDPQIYRIFEKTYGIPFAYFDDRQENIDAARVRGWNAHLFTAASDLARLF